MLFYLEKELNKINSFEGSREIQMELEKAKIIIALHKKYPVPNDQVYLPLFVGAHSKPDIGFARDDINDNISCKNPFFCELTGIYWAWKNLNASNIGLVHYRRYFKGSKKVIFNKYKRNILSDEDVLKLDNETIYLPKMRNYYIETLYDHYAHTMYIEPLDITGEIISELCPEYSYEFNKLKVRKKAHMFNMFIMPKKHFDNYCEWLFKILFELEKRIDVSNYSSFHQRLYGRISELLLDVWINTNKLSYKELPYINIEKVNWFKKGKSFLMAKFRNKKYEKSF